VTPPGGYSIFTKFLVQIENLSLTSKQYLSFHVEKTTGEFERIMSEGYNTEYTITFPRLTKALHINIVEGWNLSNNYTIYTYSPKLNIEELKSLSVNNFN
jgi:hypothetical protein